MPQFMDRPVAKSRLLREAWNPAAEVAGIERLSERRREDEIGAIILLSTVLVVTDHQGLESIEGGACLSLAKPVTRWRAPTVVLHAASEDSRRALLRRQFEESTKWHRTSVRQLPNSWGGIRRSETKLQPW